MDLGLRALLVVHSWHWLVWACPARVLAFEELARVVALTAVMHGLITVVKSIGAAIYCTLDHQGEALELGGQVVHP